MDWGELNPDILGIIAKKVGDISNFIRFRAVCKHWRSAVNPSKLPQQLPYFIRCERKTEISFNFQFGPLFGKKVYTVAIQNSQLKGEPLLYGSFTGYVLLRFLESSSWLLINPLTGFQVPLPFGIENYVCPVYFGPSCGPNSIDNEIDVVFAFKENKPTSSSTDNLIVCLWRYADRHWAKISDVCVIDDEYLRYSNGRIYAFSIYTGDARVIDVATRDVVSLIPGSSMDINYLTDVYGDVLGVQRRPQPFNLDWHNSEFLVDVFQLENGGTNPSWVKVNSIGDRMLFFDSDGNSLCLKANDFEGHRGSTVYIMNLAVHQALGCFVLRYDMESRTEVPLYLRYSKSKCFLPSLS